MVKTLLFDLDGTLLNVDMDVFLPAYLKTLAPRAASALPPRQFVTDLLAATEVMAKNQNPAKTNQEVFVADFFARTGLDPEQWMPVFDDFYRTDFHQLRPLTSPNPVARPLVEAALARGYEVVIATNPVFPRVAIEARLSWGNLDGLPFHLVTSYEVMHFSKPNPRYFAEVAEKLGRAPEECVMVGNDAGDDLTACRVGMQTFLTTDCPAGKPREDCPPTWEGSLADVLRRVEESDWSE